ncbi:POTRA domain-containing protein [Cupriavidus basilensis]
MTSLLLSSSHPDAAHTRACPGPARLPACHPERRHDRAPPWNSSRKLRRERAWPVPDVLTASPPKPASTGPLILPAESPCFRIRTVRWEGAEDFAWLRAEAGILPTQCVGGKGLEAIQDYFSARLLAQGYITTRVVIPDQNLASGENCACAWWPDASLVSRPRARPAGGAWPCPQAPADW